MLCFHLVYSLGRLLGSPGLRAFSLAVSFFSWVSSVQSSLLPPFHCPTIIEDLLNADGERPARSDARGGEQEIGFLLVRGDEGAACRTRGKRGRKDRHRVWLRRCAGHAGRHCQAGEARRPRDSPIAPLLVEGISREYTLH